ncbi:MAG: AmmeMemoRadiSam system radical SAM enzyme [Verrucomicrobiales bacterium]|nr:AmmeMemoRadiSam system radical SAM enzyme [Verrucomicrobiales bacterium]
MPRIPVANARLADVLDRHTRPADLWRAESGKVRCLACGHRCLLAEGRRGICKVRFNRDGALQAPYGYVAGLAADPVEKKPFFHLLPGNDALTFGMLGCDFHCAYCQNWLTSQALRDEQAGGHIRAATPEQLVATAQRAGARLVVSSYNEPLITAEWAVAVFRPAREAGLLCAMVSNGNATPEALDYVQPWIEAFKVDLKTFQDAHYRRLGGTLANVTRTIAAAHQRGLWLEVVTLLVPGFNDSREELRDMAAFLAGVSPDIPWHVTAFHPDYRMTGPRATGVTDLLNAVEIGMRAGLHFVYAGNLSGRVEEWENTRCPGCGGTLIVRHGFQVLSCRLDAGGRCPDCQREIPGLWGDGTPMPGQSHWWNRLPRPVRLAD